jgi:hypothetical protein
MRFANENGQDALIIELKSLKIKIHEVALYRDNVIESESTYHASNLWELLTSARDFLDFVLSIPGEVFKTLPSSSMTLFSYALIVLSTVSRLPTSAGWDSSIVKGAAGVMNIAQRLRAKFGALTQTGDVGNPEQKDVWAFFTRGLGGLIAWHQACEQQSGDGMDNDLPMHYSLPTSATRCTVADIMTSFAALRLWKPLQTHHEDENGTRGIPTAEWCPYPGNVSPDIASNFWDDEVWQSIMNDVSMLPTTAGLFCG